MFSRELDGQKFALGQVVATAGALAELAESGHQPGEFLERHQSGDWGHLGAHDAHMNNLALVDGSRILSSYRTRSGAELWIITEAEDEGGQRPCTTMLLPQEY